MNPYSLIEKVEEISGSLYLAIEGATCWRVTENLPSILVFIVQAEPVALYIYHPFSCLFISDDHNFPLNTSVYRTNQFPLEHLGLSQSISKDDRASDPGCQQSIHSPLDHRAWNRCNSLLAERYHQRSRARLRRNVQYERSCEWGPKASNYRGSRCRTTRTGECPSSDVHLM